MGPRAGKARRRFDDAVERRRARVRALPEAPSGRRSLPILTQDGEEKMVLPFALDAQILPGIALLLKAGSDQQRSARNIARQARGLDAMEAEAIERKIEDERQCDGHVALPCEWLADPVAEACGVGDATPQIGKADSADQRLVVGEDK